MVTGDTKKALFSTILMILDQFIGQKLPFITLIEINEEESDMDEDIVTVLFHAESEWNSGTGSGNSDRLFTHMLELPWIMSWDEQDVDDTKLKVDIALIIQALPESSAPNLPVEEETGNKEGVPEKYKPKGKKGKASKSKKEKPKKLKEVSLDEDKKVSKPIPKQILNTFDSENAIDWKAGVPSFPVKDAKGTRRRLRGLRDFVVKHAGENPDDTSFVVATVLLGPEDKIASMVATYGSNEDILLSFHLTESEHESVSMGDFRTLLMVHLGFK